MSETPTPMDPVQVALARLAELDLSLAEHVHAQALATTDADEINGLGRTYQRVARSLRQTLALKAKLAREDREAVARQSSFTSFRDRRSSAPATPAKGYELADAVTRVIWDEAEPEEREVLLDKLGDRIRDYIDAPGFTTRPIDDDVVRLAVELGLSPVVAAGWRQLPELPPEEAFHWDLDAEEPP